MKTTPGHVVVNSKTMFRLCQEKYQTPLNTVIPDESLLCCRFRWPVTGSEVFLQNVECGMWNEENGRKNC
jgi:hypothetical protein